MQKKSLLTITNYNSNWGEKADNTYRSKQEHMFVSGGSRLGYIAGRQRVYCCFTWSVWPELIWGMLGRMFWVLCSKRATYCTHAPKSVSSAPMPAPTGQVCNTSVPLPPLHLRKTLQPQAFTVRNSTCLDRWVETEREAGGRGRLLSDYREICTSACAGTSVNLFGCMLCLWKHNSYKWLNLLQVIRKICAWVQKRGTVWYE